MTNKLGRLLPGQVHRAGAAAANNLVTVSAIGRDSTAANSSVTLWNPVPVLSGIAPASVPDGAFAIAVNGNGFVSGAQVLPAGAPLATKFVSAWQL